MRRRGRGRGGQPGLVNLKDVEERDGEQESGGRILVFLVELALLPGVERG